MGTQSGSKASWRLCMAYSEFAPQNLHVKDMVWHTCKASYCQAWHFVCPHNVLASVFAV